MEIIITILLITIAALLLFIIVGFFFFLFDAFLELPYVATKRNKIETIINLANIKKTTSPERSRKAEGPEHSRRREIVIDLGSGDGRLLVAAAQQGAIAIGYEINPMLVMLTLIYAKLKGLSNKVSVCQTSLWKADLKPADVIFVYARQGTMQKMEDFVFKFAKRGARIVVNTDLTKPFPTKKPIKSQNGIFLYKT